MIETNRLVISDLHLGSGKCQISMVLNLLRESSYRELIIVGDLFEGGELLDKELELMHFLRKIKEKVRYVDGNHDQGLARAFGLVEMQEHVCEINGRAFCFLHGHKFENICFIFSEPLIDRLFYNFIWAFKLIGFGGFNLAKWFGDFHSNFSLHVAKRAKKYAKKRGYGVIVCGHTHAPMRLSFEGKEGRKIDYFNCGCWVDDVCTFLAIDEKGKGELYQYNPNYTSSKLSF